MHTATQLQRNSKNPKVPTFIHKLLDILKDESNTEMVSWDAEGRSFSIHNLRHFENLVLPKYFRHSRFSSFVRQLNMYGFHKVKTQSGSSCSFGN
jgi:heat shock transcription factor